MCVQSEHTREGYLQCLQCLERVWWSSHLCQEIEQHPCHRPNCQDSESLTLLPWLRARVFCQPSQPFCLRMANGHVKPGGNSSATIEIYAHIKFIQTYESQQQRKSEQPGVKGINTLDTEDREFKWLQIPQQNPGWWNNIFLHAGKKKLVSTDVHFIRVLQK